MTSRVRMMEGVNGTIRTSSMIIEVHHKMDIRGENRASWIDSEQINPREGRRSRVQPTTGRTKIMDLQASSNQVLASTKAPLKTSGTKTTTTIGKVKTRDSHTADQVAREDCQAWVVSSRTESLQG